jgi:molecular chaperone GrpE
MQQNGQKEQECKRLQQTTEQRAQESEPDSAATAIQEQGEQLRAEQQKAEEYLDLLRRTQADFVNYRRRMNQEQAEGRIAAKMELLDQLLPVFDDFGRALGTTPPDLAKHPWVQGLFLVARRLTTLLDQLGVRQIGTPGETFDPHLHEALTMEARADTPEGTILQVVRPGYALGERIIRPAQVIVAGSPSPVGSAPPQQEDSEC